MAETKNRIIDPLLDDKRVEIRGQEYQVHNPDALSFLNYRWVEKNQHRILELLEKDDFTEAEDAECSRLLDRFCRIVLAAPVEIHAALTDLQRLQVLNFFRQRSPMTTPTTASAKEENTAAAVN